MHKLAKFRKNLKLKLEDKRYAMFHQMEYFMQRAQCSNLPILTRYKCAVAWKRFKVDYDEFEHKHGKMKLTIVG